ncbi:metallophosphoesterase [Granulicella sp. dw_53]|uniref:metallophosphoesterase n=1 Tax=Granulicella sp. dw_53 TaxID=2719792 RepID=UPI001BD66E44|nr:metallophosphoesterase [Granulicella sp. dw_53]
MSVQLSQNSPARISRRKFLVGTGAGIAGLALYSGEIARHELDIVERPIAIRNLPGPFHGYRIVQISDIHLEEFTEPFFLEHVIRRVNALTPDLILLTGDFVTMGAVNFFSESHAAYHCAELLATLTCPLRYAILGNHDIAVGAPVVTRALESNGIPVLLNSFIAVERKDARIWLCGVQDPATAVPLLDATIPDKPDGPVILMAHEPDFADIVVQHPRAPLVDLMLSGHSHGGQVRLPFLGPLVLPPMGKKYYEGHYQFNNMQLYVNRGIGTVGIPFRLNCPPEVTVLTLNPA